MPFECRDKMACFDLNGRFCSALKTSCLLVCPRILLHLCEEDTFLFLLVGKLWSKAVYQGVIFESEVLLFFVREKWAKYVK